MVKAGSSSGSAYTVSDQSEDDYISEASGESAALSSRKKPRLSGTPKTARKSSKKDTKGKGKANGSNGVVDIEESSGLLRPHDRHHHDVDCIVKLQGQLLDWFEGVRDKRGMPWRKRYDASLSMEEKGQRAYEVWVSEVMLQQTQVATVIAYWNRWIEKWPIIADLAKADVEEVNAMWRGLGYYRRARSLLAGAKTVMSKAKYQGRLPDDPEVLEKEIDGVGRYTAGAICSTAYGIRTPLVDGNVHRLFTRLLAIHAPQTGPQTIKLLWKIATELVDALPRGQKRGVAGDWNQALMELGSQVCKPAAPDCTSCPLRAGCKAYAELSSPPIAPVDETCDLCVPIPVGEGEKTIPSVTVFPMRKEKKLSREEEEVVCVTEWRNGSDRKWLFTKRPEKGLLAGLFQPPTTPVPAGTSVPDRLETAYTTLSTLLDKSPDDMKLMVTSSREVAAVPHIFSHINMIYHVIHVTITSEETIPISAEKGAWLDEVQVENANIGTGVKKVWSTIYGRWGSFDEDGKVNAYERARRETGSQKPKAKTEKGSKINVKRKSSDLNGIKGGGGGNGKIVRKIMMPGMPVKSA